MAFQVEACTCLEMGWATSNDLLNHVPQDRLVVADCARLTPGHEAIGTDEQRTIRIDTVRFAPVVLHVLKLAFRPDEVSYQWHPMGLGDSVGGLTPCSSRTPCQQRQRPVVQVYRRETLAIACQPDMGSTPACSAAESGASRSRAVFCRRLCNDGCRLVTIPQVYLQIRPGRLLLLVLSRLSLVPSDGPPRIRTFRIA